MFRFHIVLAVLLALPPVAESQQPLTLAEVLELARDRSPTLRASTLYRTEMRPQAEANVTSAFASFRVGRVDFMTLLDAQMTTNRYGQELYALLAEHGRMVAELEAAVGRDLTVAHDAGETR